tara:strand:+ start:3719 stop:4687 length:969 start_codon:yes stop_codon:yes gene_type:complete
MNININDDNVICANNTGAVTNLSWLKDVECVGHEFSNHFVTVDVKYNYKGGVFYHKGTTEVHVFNCDDDDVRNNGCKITKQRAIDYVKSDHVDNGQFTDEDSHYDAEVTEICYAVRCPQCDDVVTAPSPFNNVWCNGTMAQPTNREELDVWIRDMPKAVRHLQRGDGTDALVSKMIEHKCGTVIRDPKKFRAVVVSDGYVRRVVMEGDGVSWSVGSDTHSGTVVSVAKNGKSVDVVEDVAVLLNGSQSGADDALEFTPGGFFGHTEGEQRYRYAPGNPNDVMTFSFRASMDRFKLRGVSINGSMRSAFTLYAGRSKHHDYNF